MKPLIVGGRPRGIAAQPEDISQPQQRLAQVLLVDQVVEVGGGQMLLDGQAGQVLTEGIVVRGMLPIAVCEFMSASTRSASLLIAWARSWAACSRCCLASWYSHPGPP